MADDKKIIFSMNKVSKTYSSTNKQVLKDIYLSFFMELRLVYWVLTARENLRC